MSTSDPVKMKMRRDKWQRVYAAWKTGRYQTRAELARALGMHLHGVNYILNVMEKEVMK
jgi:hypothetical protein